MSSNCSRVMLHQCAPPCVATISIAFPVEIIRSCVGLYFRFALRFRSVEEMLAMRGVPLSHKTAPENGTSSSFGRHTNGFRFTSLLDQAIRLRVHRNQRTLPLPLACS